MAKLWSKGNFFKLGNRKYQVSDLEIETFFQTGHTTTYLKYFKKEKGKWVSFWVDSNSVTKVQERK